MMMTRKTEFKILVLLVTVAAIGTFLRAEDRINWLLDAGWVLIGTPVIFFFRDRFPLTPLLVRLLAFHACILIAGRFWTYEQNPIGLWFQRLFSTERNHFDRFGHFLQGFVPAILFREIYYRTCPLNSDGWVNYFSWMSCAAFTALFELLEWIATVIAKAEGDGFLGHQGDVWDAQWDMLWAVIGASISILVLAPTHRKQIRALEIELER